MYCKAIFIFGRYLGSSACAASTGEFFFVLFPEAVADREEVPAPLLVHVPYVRLLTRVLCLVFVD